MLLLGFNELILYILVAVELTYKSFVVALVAASNNAIPTRVGFNRLINTLTEYHIQGINYLTSLKLYDLYIRIHFSVSIAGNP